MIKMDKSAGRKRVNVEAVDTKIDAIPVSFRKRFCTFF